jgi:hypothetical protein
MFYVILTVGIYMAGLMATTFVMSWINAKHGLNIDIDDRVTLAIIWPLYVPVLVFITAMEAMAELADKIMEKK